MSYNRPIGSAPKKKNVIVLCGGCFNTVHEGHIYFLEQAKSLGDKLVTIIANDTHNLKPYARPDTVRAKGVRALKIADKVVIGKPRGFLSSVLKVKPNIIALGYDQTLPADVAAKLDKLGVKVRRLKRYKGLSTHSKMGTNA